MRASFARAAAVRPRLLVLDCPERAHDPEALDRFARSIRDTQEVLEATVVVATADSDLALRLGHHVVLLHAGRVLAEGTPDEIRQGRWPDEFRP